MPLQKETAKNLVCAKCWEGGEEFTIPCKHFERMFIKGLRRGEEICVEQYERVGNILSSKKNMSNQQIVARLAGIRRTEEAMHEERKDRIKALRREKKNGL